MSSPNCLELRARRFLRDERAWALYDFTLVFPLLLMLVLVISQAALLLHARIITSYAAFAAARSAVVWLEEGRDVATERAHRAAAVGLMPIASDEVSLLDGLGSTLQAAPLYLHSPDGDTFRRIVRGGKKLAYSQSATRVELLLPSGELGPHDPVTVVVEHDFHLTIPYADGIFRSGRGRHGIPIRTLRSQKTLTHEGRVQTR